ncbi:uncharacterized protein [Amphiura filiformis]|uniref:uncharacterized protein n=1 Tax=Amphiura filiformis TaxID=82378 RepID=UPI003B219F4B
MDQGEDAELLKLLSSSLSQKRKGQPVKKPDVGSCSCTHLLGTKMKNYFNNPEFSDVIIKIGEQQYHAHGFILSSWSEVFKGKITEAKNNAASTSSIPDSCTTISLQLETSMEPYITDQFISYFYTGEIKYRDTKDAEVLINLAKKYDIKSLINLCEDFLVDSLQQDDLEKAMNTFKTAQELQLSNLIKKCKLVFCINFECIPELFWRKLEEDVVHEMIRSSFLVVENESVVLDKLMLWLDGLDNQQKMLCLQKMIPYVRFVHMSSRQLMDAECCHGKLIEEYRPCAVQKALEMRAVIAEAIQTKMAQAARKKGSKATNKPDDKILKAVRKIPPPRVYWHYNAAGSPQLAGGITEIILIGSEKLIGIILQDDDHIWRGAPPTDKWKLKVTLDEKSNGEDEEWRVLLEINPSTLTTHNVKFVLAVSVQPTGGSVRMAPSIRCAFGSVNDYYFHPIKLRLGTGQIGEEKPGTITLCVVIYVWKEDLC